MASCKYCTKLTGPGLPGYCETLITVETRWHKYWCFCSSNCQLAYSVAHEFGPTNPEQDDTEAISRETAKAMANLLRTKEQELFNRGYSGF